MRYIKRPIVVEAIQWTGNNEDAIIDFTGGHFDTVGIMDRREDPDRTAMVYDKLHSTWVGVYTGQWIIKGIKGEFYPRDAQVFAETYEPAP